RRQEIEHSRPAPLGDRLRFGAVGFADPQLLGAAAVAGEDDQFTVGRKFGLSLERHAADYAFCLAADNRQSVDVSEQIEDDRLTVGRNVQRHPSSFVGRERDFAFGLQNQFFFLLLFLFIPLLVLLLRAGARSKYSRRASGEQG